jgi:hypothetical protein
VFSLSSTQTFVIQPLYSVDAYLTLAVPLINVGAWQQHRVSAHNAEAADRSRLTTQISWRRETPGYALKRSTYWNL